MATSLVARIILTGDELLRGFIQDANSGFLAASLRDIGFDVDSIQFIADDLTTIALNVESALRECDLVVVSGGLGPTHDDRTSEAVANALGLHLEINDDALAVVEERVRAYGRMSTPEEVATFTPGNRKQATMPSGATWLDPLGTAPGYVVDVGASKMVCVLPGPPSELRHAWEMARNSTTFADVAARITPSQQRLIRVWGVPESRASQVLGAAGHEDSASCRVTLCARDGELEIALRGSSTESIERVFDHVRDAFVHEVFAIDDHRSIAEIVGDLLSERGYSIATAESCTGGMVAAAITDVPGSSAWMRGGIVSYANEVKHSSLGVATTDLEQYGAVSEQVAHAMAAGAQRVLGAHVAISTTGIAGPDGGSEAKPVGTVFIGIATPASVTVKHVRIPGDRATVRRRASVIALHQLRLALMMDS